MNIRKNIIEKRKMLSKKEVERFSDEIYKNLFSLPFIKGKTNYFIYNSFKNEADTTKIVKTLKESGKTILYPLTIGDKMYAVKNIGDDFIKGSFGEDVPKNYTITDSVDIAIIPLVACDKNLNRIGYGKGFYDKFLKTHDCIKIGICYDFQVIENITPNEWDVPLDYVITPTKIIKK